MEKEPNQEKEIKKELDPLIAEKQAHWQRKAVVVKDVSKKPKIIAQFIKDKNKNPLKALRNYSPEILGEEQWIIGLIGMFQLPNLEKEVVRQIIQHLLICLNQQSEEDSIFINFIVEAFKQKALDFDDLLKNIIITKVKKLNMLKNKNVKVREAVKSILLLSKIIKEADYSANKEKLKSSKAKGIEIELDSKAGIKTKFPKTTVSGSKTVKVSSSSPAAQNQQAVASYILSLALRSGLKGLGASGLAYSVLFPNVLERNIRLHSQPNAAKVLAAILTHPSVVMTAKLKNFSAIYFSETKTIHYIRSFFDQFLNLLEEGFKSICAFLPNSDFWPSFHYAKHASLDFGHYIQVYDTKTFGAGLSLIMEEAAGHILKQKDIYQIQSLVEKDLSKLRYWVIPNDTKTCEKHYWFMKIKNERIFRKAINKKITCPVIALYDPISIIDNLPDISEAFEYLNTLIQSENKRMNIFPKRFIITQNNNSSLAINLGKKLKSKYPKSEISIVQANKVLIAEFGNHISIGML